MNSTNNYNCTMGIEQTSTLSLYSLSSLSLISLSLSSLSLSLSSLLSLSLSSHSLLILNSLLYYLLYSLLYSLLILNSLLYYLLHSTLSLPLLSSLSFSHIHTRIHIIPELQGGKYSGVLSSISQLGFKGLYNNWLSTILRDIPFTMVFFSISYKLKEALCVYIAAERTHEIAEEQKELLQRRKSQKEILQRRMTKPRGMNIDGLFVCLFVCLFFAIKLA